MSVSYKRVALCYFMAVVLFFVCVLRVSVVAVTPEYAKAAVGERSRKIVLSYKRGTIFDTNMTPLTNARTKTYAIIFEEAMAITALYEYFSRDEIDRITEEIRKNGFSVRSVSRTISASGVYCFQAVSHIDDNTLAKHIIGYTDSENKGVSGLQLAFDSLLSSEEETSVTFTLDGHSKVILGDEPRINNGADVEKNGVKITIDKEIQQIAEQEATAINCGAIIITEVGTGKIRAMVSRPEYSLENLGEALNSADTPLINRALYAYNIGSVFKPCVVAAGLDNFIDGKVNCTGYTDVDGLTFSCHKTSGHGEVDINDALKYSCNSFFYTYIQDVGAQGVINTAKLAGLTGEIQLADGIVNRKGSLGDTNTILNSKRALANLSIGQGAMMLSPLAINNLYMAIAGDGVYRTPTLVEGKVENGNLTEAEPLPKEVRVMKSSTASTLKASLATVLEEGGTGENAKPELTSAAGKTGTAQTGIKKDGKRVTNSWFCGFFPLENPKYAVTILAENSSGGCGGVFADIADGITALESNRG